MLRTTETGNVGALDRVVALSLVPSELGIGQSEQICSSRWSESMVLAATVVRADIIDWRC